MIKDHVLGTHRACRPEQTWARIKPLLPLMGITRVADLTWLDDLGIPTFQAFRPSTRSLSVSQGKGLTPMLARVSAVMESAELWHAERPELPTTRATLGEVRGGLGYDPFALNRPRPTLLNDEMVLRWTEALRLTDFNTDLLPYDYVDMSSTFDFDWWPPVLTSSSNGLSSGNTWAEAVLHGLYEIIEREANSAAGAFPEHERNYVDVATLPPPAAGLIERFHAAGAVVSLVDTTGPTRIASYGARLWSPSFPVVFSGSGCHVDPTVAMCRALTEAAQGRLTAIAGSRDDLKTRTWAVLRDSLFGVGRADEHHGRPYLPQPGLLVPTDDLEADLASVVGAVVTAFGIVPMAVTLTRPEIGIDVVKVVCPGLRHGDL